jgi:hypothetical protein
MKTYLICNLALALAVLTIGCDRDGVKVYHVDATDSTTVTPPPVAASTAMPSAMPSTMPAGLPAPDNSALPQLKYTLPAGWQEKPLSQLRVASFEVSENGQKADVSVIPLGGMAGGDLPNVNRWRGQVGLAPIDEAAVQKITEKVVIAGQDAGLFDIAGTAPGSGDAQRIIASVLHRDDAAWFFKMAGDAALVEKQKPAFVSFLKSFQFSGSTAPAGMDLSKLPEGHPAIGEVAAGSATMPAPDAGTVPTWTVPPDWQPAPLSQFLIAKFSIADASGAQAAVNVSSLAGDGGGLLANVNRWRGQLGLSPFTEADLLPYENGINDIGSPFGIIDFTGTDSRTGKHGRIIGAVVPKNGQTWFYKLMGDDNIVTQQKNAFIKFIQSAKYPDVH